MFKIPHNKTVPYLGVVAVTFATATRSLATARTIVVAINDKTAHLVNAHSYFN